MKKNFPWRKQINWDLRTGRAKKVGSMRINDQAYTDIVKISIPGNRFSLRPHQRMYKEWRSKIRMKRIKFKISEKIYWIGIDYYRIPYHKGKYSNKTLH